MLIPALIVAALIGITALGAAIGPYPAAVKTTTVKPSAAATYCPPARQDIVKTEDHA